MTKSNKDQDKSEVTQVTLGDKNVETSQFERYKGLKGRTDRVAILSSTLIRGYRHYHPGQRRSFRAPKTPEIAVLVNEELGPPEQRFALTIFHYLTDGDGNLIDVNKCQGRVKTWAISEARYEELSNLHRSWPLLDAGFGEPQHDMQLACTEEQYQRINFTPMPEAHWKKKEAWYKALKEKELVAQPKVKMTLGREMSDTEIMEMLGTALPSQTGGVENAGDVDLSDITDDIE
ncbi:MAG TPA: hypothetical protein ENI27_00085 [bacterium]|nr:hypothetical protein [bacterium]